MTIDAPPPRPRVFCARARRAKLDRAAATLAKADFLHRRAAEDAVDRVESVLRGFDEALVIGPAAAAFAAALTPRAGVERVTYACESARLLGASGTQRVAACEPDLLPFADGAFDLVVSLMSLHVVDDLPGALAEARRVLRPDGLFVALFPGERTLTELRGVLREAEAMVTGGVTPRVSPMVAVRDAGGLLQRAGFALPVADVVAVPVRYGEPLRLLSDLRAMGETNAAVAGGKGALRRDVVAEVASRYERIADEEGRLPATFELVALGGWAPHESQPKPLTPGSAKTSLADAVRRAGG